MTKEALSGEALAKPSLFGRFLSFINETDKGKLFLCFILPFLLTFLTHAAFGVFPFGTESVLVLDLNAQYVYFFNALRDFVYGEGSLLYSFVRAMGGEFMGIYAYYIASPLSYIVCLFPKAAIPEALWLIFMIKSGLCGLCFGYFLHETTRCPHYPTVALSVFYALSGYATAMQSNTMWIDALYLLPLCILGVHRVVKKKGFVLYILSLTATLLFNYYIGYMTCIFLLFYFFCHYFSEKKTERNPLGEKAHFIRSLTRMGIYSLTAIAMAAVIILPAYYSLTFGKDTFTTPKYEFTEKFYFLEMFGKTLFASYDTLKPAGLPFLYCGVITLFLVPIYFVHKKIAAREKITNGILLLFLLFTSSIQATDLVWHGFQAPNWMNCRYSFMIIFVLLTLAARALSHKDGVSPKVIIVTGALLSVLTTALFFTNEDEKVMKTVSTAISLGLIVVYALFLLFFFFKPHLKNALRIALASVLVVEMLSNGILTLVGLEMDVAISRRANYGDIEERFQDVIDFVKEKDGDAFYRMEKTVARKLNDSYQFGYYGLSGSTSTLNRSQIDFLSVLGFTARSNYSQYCFPNAVTDSLLGVRYVFANTERLMEGTYILRYAKVAGAIFEIDETNRVVRRNGAMYFENGVISEKLQKDRDVLVYENPYALSLGFMTSEDAGNITFVQPEVDGNGDDILFEDGIYYSIREGKCKTVFERLNTILSAMMGEEVTLFTPVEYTVKTENIKLTTTYRTYEKRNEETGAAKKEQFYSYRYSTKDKSMESKVSFTFEGVDGKMIYMHIPATSFNESALQLNGKKQGYYLGIYNYGILPLGEFEDNSQNTVTFTPNDSGTYIGKLDEGLSYFYTMDEEVFSRVMAYLSDGNMEFTEFHDDSFTVTVNASEDRPLLLTTVPYDKGWQVTVDGEAAETKPSIDALLSVTLTPGTHTVSFRYFPVEYTLGIYISLVGVAVFLVLLTVQYRNQLLSLVKKLTAKKKAIAEAETVSDENS